MTLLNRLISVTIYCISLYPNNKAVSSNWTIDLVLIGATRDLNMINLDDVGFTEYATLPYPSPEASQKNVEAVAVFYASPQDGYSVQLIIHFYDVI